MKATIFDINNRRLGHVDFGATDLAFADAAFSAYAQGLPLPSLVALEWDVFVYNADGRRVGKIIPNRADYGRLDSADVVNPASGAAIGRAGLVGPETVRLWSHSAQRPHATGDFVAWVRFNGDLQADVERDPFFFGFDNPNRNVGSVKFDPSPILQDRLTRGRYAAALPQIAIFRPNYYAGCAALVLLLHELGG